MCDVSAPNVECPGDILWIGHQQRVDARPCQFGADALDFVRRAFPGELEFADAYRSGRRCRAVAPQGVNRIVIDGNELCAGGGASLRELFGLVARVQPRVIADLCAALEFFLEPPVRRAFNQMFYGINCSIDLRVGLQCVTAVDE